MYSERGRYVIIRDIGRYAYNSKGVSADTLKEPRENTELASYPASQIFEIGTTASVALDD